MQLTEPAAKLISLKNAWVADGFVAREDFLRELEPVFDVLADKQAAEETAGPGGSKRQRIDGSTSAAAAASAGGGFDISNLKFDLAALGGPAAPAPAAASATAYPPGVDAATVKALKTMNLDAGKPVLSALPPLDIVTANLHHSSPGGVGPTRPRGLSDTAVHGDPSSSSATGLDNLAMVATSLGGGAGGAGGVATRTFELWHYTGIEDGGRSARCTRLVVRQSDSGLPPMANPEDARLAGALGGGGGGGVSIGSGPLSNNGLSVEDATKRAMELSMADTGPPPAAAPVSAEAAREAGKASAVEALLRTKWPGVVVSFDGPAPSLD
jgi:hypothetical protein